MGVVETIRSRIFLVEAVFLDDFFLFLIMLAREKEMEKWSENKKSADILLVAHFLLRRLSEIEILIHTGSENGRKLHLSVYCTVLHKLCFQIGMFMKSLHRRTLLHQNTRCILSLFCSSTAAMTRTRKASAK